MPGGRPELYTAELSEKLCSHLANGESLSTACKRDDMPSTITVFAWFRKHPEFLSKYDKAKKESADALVEQMLDIADDSSQDFIETIGEDGKVKRAANKEYVQRSRLRVDTRKWIASKLRAKKYGERVTHDTTIHLTDMSQDELDAKILRLQQLTLDTSD